MHNLNPSYENQSVPDQDDVGPAIAETPSKAYQNSMNFMDKNVQLGRATRNNHLNKS